MSWRMGRSKEWHRGYWDGFSRLPPSNADAQYLLGHMDGEEKARSDRQQARREIRGHSTKLSTSSIDTTETLDHKFRTRQRDALTFAEKARQARGAAARWIKRSNAYAHEGQFREAADAQTEAEALGRMASSLEAEVAHMRTRSHATKAPDLSAFATHKAAVTAAARAYNAAQRAYSLIEKRNLSKHPATKEATAAAHRRYMDTAAAYNEAVAAQAQYMRTGR